MDEYTEHTTDHGNLCFKGLNFIVYKFILIRQFLKKLVYIKKYNALLREIREDVHKWRNILCSATGKFYIKRE